MHSFLEPKDICSLIATFRLLLELSLLLAKKKRHSNTLYQVEKERVFLIGTEGEYNFRRSAGLHYEAKHVQERISGGHLESDLWPLQHTLNNMKTLEEIAQQLGVKYE